MTFLRHSFDAMMLLLVAVAFTVVAALPMAVAIGVSAAVPGAGLLKDEVGVWSMVHLLWMYPALFMVGTVYDGVASFATERRPGPVAECIGLVVQWGALTAMFLVFFRGLVGASLGAALALVLFTVFVGGLERRLAAEEDGSDAPEVE